jgi:colicin import membrane protein
MNARRIPRTAVENSLRLVRLPLDAAIDRLPGNGTGARPTAKLALDCTDATVRAFAGTILADPVLRADAQQRRAALKQREQAQALRGAAHRKTEAADARLEERHDQVARQRAQSQRRAQGRREDADREALAAKAEARRLREAASRTKAERKAT